MSWDRADWAAKFGAFVRDNFAPSVLSSDCDSVLDLLLSRARAVDVAKVLQGRESLEGFATFQVAMYGVPRTLILLWVEDEVYARVDVPFYWRRSSWRKDG